MKMIKLFVYARNRLNSNIPNIYTKYVYTYVHVYLVLFEHPHLIDYPMSAA